MWRRIVRTIALLVAVGVMGVVVHDAANAWYWDLGPYGVYYSYPRNGYFYGGAPYYQRGGPPYYPGHGPPYYPGYGPPYEANYGIP